MIRELKEKGVSEEIINETVHEAYKEREESEIARRLAAGKIASYKGLEKKVMKRRLMAFLLRRGFSYETCYSVINEELTRPKG